MCSRLTISVPEAAARLGVSRATAYDAVRRGEIPSIRIARRVLIPVAALEALLAGCMPTPPAAPEAPPAPRRQYRAWVRGQARPEGLRDGRAGRSTGRLAVP